jgi:GT2 family glycosyltransferase
VRRASDIVMETPHIYRYLRDFMDRESRVGVASPKVLNVDGTIQGLNKRYPTVLDLFLRRFLPRILRPAFQKRLDYHEMRDVGYDDDCDVPFLSGAFMFCRTDLLRVLGGFNPQYSMFFDDVDLCRRVQRTHRTVYCHEVRIVHFWRRIAHKKWTETFRHGRMAYRYFREWGFRWY